METGNIIMPLRKESTWSQRELVSKCDVAPEVIGQYQLTEALE